MRDSGEFFLGAWAGSFLEGVFHLSKTEFLRGRQAFGCRGAEEKFGEQRGEFFGELRKEKKGEKREMGVLSVLGN